MIRYESQCVNCGFPCIYEACPNYKVRTLICDSCGSEENKLYKFSYGEYCEQCVLNIIEKIE